MASILLLVEHDLERVVCNGDSQERLTEGSLAVIASLNIATCHSSNLLVSSFFPQDVHFLKIKQKGQEMSRI